VLLVQFHVEELLEQRRQPERLDAEQLRRDPRVEDVVDVPAVVLMQQSQIVVGVVEHNFDPGILENCSEPRRSANRKGIDHRAPLTRRDLQEVDPIDEPVEVRTLGIERYLPHSGDVVQKQLDLLWSIEVQQQFRV
jgi:hypothetical protein